MSTADTRAWMQRYAAALNGQPKTPELVRQYVDNADLEQHIVMFEAAFPGYELIADDLIVEGDKAALRGTFRGTHRGELMGIAPTGRQVEITLQAVYRIENDKIVEFWMNADVAGLMQQLGAVPATA